MFVVCQRCEAEIPANFASLLHHSLVDHKPVRIEPIDRYKCRYCRHSGQDWNELAKHVSLVHFGSSESSIADRFASLKSLSYAASLIRRNFGECQIETNPIGSSGTVDFYFNQSHFEAVERPNQEIFLRVKKKLMLANSQPYRKLPESPVFNFKRLRRN